MRAHHFAWLSAHPDRTEDWLRERIADGFDVHHLDGNHDNNAPLNLVLIEHLDHLRCIHSAPGNRLVAIKFATMAARRRRKTTKSPKVEVQPATVLPFVPKEAETAEPKRRRSTKVERMRLWVPGKKLARSQRVAAMKLID